MEIVMQSTTTGGKVSTVLYSVVMHADLILSNASVITMDSLHPSARFVAVKGARICAVGRGETESLKGPETRVVDCGGKTVVPGFNDAHCHVFSLVRSLLSVDLTPRAVRSVEDIKSALRRRAQETPPGRWISGDGFNQFYLAEHRLPNRRDLDESTSLHPVVISHFGLHACVLNSPALRLAGISAETPDPPVAVIDRDLTGEPTGVLYEMLPFIRESVMPRPSREDIEKGMALVSQRFLENGITSVQDASVNNDLSRWQTFKSLRDSGVFEPRLNMMLGPKSLPEFQSAGIAPGSGDDYLRLGAVKVIITETTGELQPAQSELDRLARECTSAGFQLAFHAVQESAVEAAISALESLNSTGTVARLRHRIEHCSECPPRLLERLAKVRPVVVTQPLFVYHSGERYLATVEEWKLPWLYGFKSLIEAGLTVAASSDAPVVPLNPMEGVYAAVTRGTESGQYLAPEQAIAVGEALAAYTRNGAHASFEDHVKGSIAPGMLADMVVLSADPNRVPQEEIKDISVEMTVLGGKVAWES